MNSHELKITLLQRFLRHSLTRWWLMTESLIMGHVPNPFTRPMQLQRAQARILPAVTSVRTQSHTAGGSGVTLLHWGKLGMMISARLPNWNIADWCKKNVLGVRSFFNSPEHCGKLSHLLFHAPGKSCLHLCFITLKKTSLSNLEQKSVTMIT